MLSILLSSKRINDVSIYCLHIMNCTMPQLLRCQHMIKCMLKAVCDLHQISNRRCTLSGMSRYGLNPPKLTKHPLQQISHLAVSVSEPSRVKVDPLKRTCLTVLSLWDHDNATQIQPIQMVLVVVIEKSN